MAKENNKAERLSRMENGNWVVKSKIDRVDATVKQVGKDMDDVRSRQKGMREDARNKFETFGSHLGALETKFDGVS